MLSLRDERVIHSIKTGLACLIGFILTKSTHLPVDQWLIITILVVMCAQVSVGSMIQKSYMRFLGTFAGSMVAAITLLLFGTDPVIIAIIISISAMFFSYIATSQNNINESGTLGAVTTTIILVGQNPTILMAVERFIEISIGILIAALISQFVLPIHARKHLRISQAKTLKQLRSYYLATLLTDQASSSNYHEIDENIIKSLISQRKLATEAEREPYAKKNFIVTHFSSLLFCEREILRAITFMHHAYKSSPETKKIFSSMTVSHEFHDKVCEIFAKIASHIEKKPTSGISVDMPSVQPIKDIIHSTKHEFSDDDTTYANAFLFCAEILVARLHDLIACMQYKS